MKYVVEMIIPDSDLMNRKSVNKQNSHNEEKGQTDYKATKKQ
jgi:hypothetical protein